MKINVCFQKVVAALCSSKMLMFYEVQSVIMHLKVNQPGWLFVSDLGWPGGDQCNIVWPLVSPLCLYKTIRWSFRTRPDVILASLSSPCQLGTEDPPWDVKCPADLWSWHHGPPAAGQSSAPLRAERERRTNLRPRRKHFTPLTFIPIYMGG